MHSTHAIERESFSSIESHVLKNQLVLYLVFVLFCSWGDLTDQAVVSLCESKVKSYCRGNTTIENNFFQKKPKFCNVTMSPIWKILTLDMQNETTALNSANIYLFWFRLEFYKSLGLQIFLKNAVWQKSGYVMSLHPLWYYFHQSPCLVLFPLYGWSN